MNNSSIKEEWLLILNPNAGRGKGWRDWGRISSLLEQYHIPFSVLFTGAIGHAIKLTIQGIKEGYRKILVVGGDGTMNEVVNGIFLQSVCPTRNIILAMITVGTGNDWGRMFSVPSDYEKAVRLIKAFHVYIQDAGVVRFYHGTERAQRYFINIAGLGFDAVVVRRTNLQKEKGRGGKAVYFYNLLRSLLAYKNTITEIDIDGHKISNSTFTISIGIGKYSGGGMMQTPCALADDGLFDITVVKKISKADLIMSLRMLYDGSILEHPKIEGYKGKNIRIDSDPLIHLEADGESLGHSPLEFQIIPASLEVICGYQTV